MNEKIIIDVGVVGEDNAVKGIQRLEISVKSIADATTQAAEATQKFTDSMKEAGDVAKTTADANNILADKYHLNAEAATQNAEATQNVAKAQEEATAQVNENIAKQRRLQKAQEEGRELRATRGRPRKLGTGASMSVAYKKALKNNFDGLELNF